METAQLLSFLARKGLTVAGTALAAHGILGGAGEPAVEDFVGAGMTIAGILWSWWREQGQAEVRDALESLKRHVHAIPPAVASVDPAVKAAKEAAIS